MVLPLLFGHSWLSAARKDRRSDLETLLAGVRIRPWMAAAGEGAVPARVAGKSVHVLRIGDGGLEACIRALLGHPEPLEILLPLVSDSMKLAALLLKSRGLLEGWKLTRWGRKDDPTRVRKSVEIGLDPRAPKAGAGSGAVPGAEPLLVGLSVVGDKEFESRDLAAIGATLRRSGRRLDEIWLLHFRGQRAQVERMARPPEWSRCVVRFVLIDAEPDRQYEQFSTAAVESALPAGRDGRTVEFVVNFCRGREPVKLAYLELAASGSLPGAWMLPDPADPRDDASAVAVDPTRLPAVAHALEKAEQEAIDEAIARHVPDPTRSVALKDARRMAWKSVQGATEDIEPILVLGETGSGKTHLVRAMAAFVGERAGGLREGAFQSLNCAHFGGNSDLLLSNLFGHAKGAFTGAHEAREGAFAKAAGGVLFLDEVGEMPLAAQAMLLKSLDRDGERGPWIYTPVGADRERTSSFVLVCGTNRDLSADVAEGRFRRDLYERIGHRILRMPSLRERIRADQTDAEAWALLTAVWKDGGCHVLSHARRPLVELMRRHDWPGNWRELVRWGRRLRELSICGMIGEEQVAKSVDALDRAARPAVAMPSRPVVSDREEVLRMAGGNNAAVYWLAVGCGLEAAGHANPTMRGKWLRAQWTPAQAAPRARIVSKARSKR